MDRPTASANAGSTPRRIVIVDDNEDAASMMAILLSRSGHEIRSAYNGAQALEVCAEVKPHVVFMDIGMPVMDGYEACRRMRKMPWGQSTYVVALTGYGNEEDIQRSRDAGFDHHLVKPISRDDLLAVIQKAG